MYPFFSLFIPLLFLLLAGNNLFSQDQNDFSSFSPILMPAKGHTSAVWSAKYSPDGKYILTRSMDQTVKIWDVESGKLLTDIIGHTAFIRSAQYSLDGKHIITASEDRTAKIWDADSGKLLTDLIGHTDEVKSARFSPDGKHIITASEDHTAKIWNAKSGKLLNDLIGHTDEVWSANYSPDGKYIITASADHTAKIWDAESGKLLNDLIGHKDKVTSAQLSPDRKHILTVSNDRTAKIWDAESGKLLINLIGHKDEVWSAQFSPDGNHIITASADHTAKLWDAESGKLLINLIGHTDKVWSAQFSPDGKHILTYSGHDQSVKIWDANSGKLSIDKIGHNDMIHSAQYSPDGKQILTASEDRTAKIWDAESGKLVVNLTGQTLWVSSVQFSSDGKHIITSSATAKVWDAESGKLLTDLIGHTGGVFSAQFSPDGKHIITTSVDHTAKVWDTSSGKLVVNLIGHTGWVSSAQFSPDGKHIITSSYDHTAKLWDAESGKLLIDLIGHTNEVRSAQFSPDGKHIITASEDSTAKLWDASSGKLVVNLTGHTIWISSAQFSPDGKYIVTSGGNHSAKIWNAESGKLLIDLKGHTHGIYSAQYSPDGKYILTASGDHTAKVWDAESGKLLSDLTGHTNQVWSAQFSPDGKHIITASEDRTAKVWDTESGKLVHILEGHASRVLLATFSPDSKYIITSSADGSVIFWKMDSGKQLIKLIPLTGNNWIVLHPSGLFDATPQAMRWMYYVIGMEVIELEQLKERFYEPGLYEKVMVHNGSLRNVDAFESVALYPEIESSIQEHELIIKLKERNGGIGKVSLFVNNKEVIPDANINRDTILKIGLSQFDKFYLGDTTNTISIRTYNSDGWLKSDIKSHIYTPELIYKKGEEERAPLLVNLRHDPHLYAVVIGTSDYVGDDLDLQFADKDSKDMFTAIEQTSNELFGSEKVHIEWFTSNSFRNSKMGSKDNIKAAFDSIATKAKAEDILLLYLSGHGVIYGGTENEQFYYLTKDMYSGDLSDPKIRSSYAISTEEMTQWINNIAAQKQVMILDACSSGKVVEDILAVRNVPTSQIRALDRMKDRTGMFVLAGSAADKVSYEASQFGQGLLTYSLLLGMSGAALKEGQSIDVMNLFQYARDQVPEFAKNIGGVQTPTLAFPTDASSFDIGLVTDKVNIPLNQVKSLFTRSNFQEEESFRDFLRLSKALDKYLVDASSGPSSRGVIFIDVDEYENAFSVNGRYNLQDNEVSLQGRLFKGKEKIGDFKITSDRNHIEQLVEKILDEIVIIINNKK